MATAMLLRRRPRTFLLDGAVLLILLSHLLIHGASIQCKNEQGEDVDYWFAYKYPDAAGYAYDGQAYSFLTSADPANFSMSAYQVSDGVNSLMGVTLAPIYASAAARAKLEGASSSSSSSSDAEASAKASAKAKAAASSLGWMMYNDQWPDSTYTESYGHSKGVLAFDADGGFFLQHSVPDFPNWAADGYLYGGSQMKYGQQLSCFSLSLEALNSVATTMRYSGPWVYDYAPLSSDDANAKADPKADPEAANLTAATAAANASLPAVTAVVNGSTRGLYWTNGTAAVTTATLGGLPLRVFSKSGGYGQDMVDMVLSPALETPLWSQSWLNSGGPLGPYCPADGDSVVDTATLRYGPASGPGTVAWNTTDDHSKWAVGAGGGGDSAASAWVCIVDNNRVCSQYTRGGLATCTAGAPDWRAALAAGILSEAACGGGGQGGYDDDAGGCSTDDYWDDNWDDDKWDDTPASRDDDLTCCYSTQTTPCNSGDVCCLSSCSPPAQCSYTESGCSGSYGQAHGCEWKGGMCVVP